MTQELSRDSVKQGIYKHFKGNIYHILGVFENASNTRNQEKPELIVAYIPQQGEHAGKKSYRDLAEFLDEVDRPEHNYKGPRFILLEEKTFI